MPLARHPMSWFDEGAAFQIMFSRFNGEQFEWLNVASKKDMPSRVEEEISIGDMGRRHITGAVRIVLRSRNDGSKYFGIRDINICGVPAAVAVHAIFANNKYSSTYAASRLLEGGYWSSKVYPY